MAAPIAAEAKTFQLPAAVNIKGSDDSCLRKLEEDELHIDYRSLILR